MAKGYDIVLYPEDGWTCEKIIDIFAKYQSMKEYAIILHDKDADDTGKPKKTHFHVYIGFGNTNVSIEKTAKWFEIKETQVQRIKTNKYCMLKYYLHENLPNKHQYNLCDMIANFDVKTFFQSKERKDSIDVILKKCADGEITQYNFAQFIDPVLYARFESKIKAAWAYADHLNMIVQNGRSDCQTIWLYGESGTGKTTLSQMFAELKNMPIYRTSTGNDPFSYYKGQPIVVLDDLRANSPYTYEELLQILDPHYRPAVHSRYRDVNLKARYICITSVLSPQEIAAQYKLSGNDTATQLYRRIGEVWNVTHDNVIFSRFDLEKNRFEVIGKETNPIKAYLGQQNVRNQEKIDGVGFVRSAMEKITGVIQGQQLMFENFEDDGVEFPFPVDS